MTPPEPVSLCADDLETRTLVIAASGERYWVPVFAVDLACALVSPDEITMGVYEVAIAIAKKRLEWTRRSAENAKKANALFGGVPVFAVDLACAILWPDIGLEVYELAVDIANKRLEWTRRSTENAKEVDALFENLRRTKGGAQ